MMLALGSLPIVVEQDVVTARQRARDVARAQGFEAQDQARVSTAVSEIARNALRHARDGRCEFWLDAVGAPQALVIRIHDHGPGMADADADAVTAGHLRSPTPMGVGLAGAQRLVDACDIRTRPTGTEVTLRKALPQHAPALGPSEARRIAVTVGERSSSNPYDELRAQHRDLLQALADLRERQEELLRLNRELEDTNRGVVALYAELDEKADHLRRADEMKTRFLSNMSHEFRTPLNSIRALSGLLLDRVDGPLTGEQETQVGYIRKAAEDLSALVEDLLDIAKIEAGRIEVHATVVSVPNLFSALRGMLRPLLVAEAVKLRFDTPDDLPLLLTDEAKLSQILRNFISNALKFTERGEVRVEASHEAADGIVRFAVHDTGIGIAAEHLEAIFEEFVQVHGPLQRRVKGTGLGLPLCRRLATLLGGRVGVTSEPGLGSCFTLELPLRGASATTPAGVPVSITPAPEPWRIPVLVVEDQPELLLHYERMLRRSAYQPVPARTVAEARAAVQRARPAAIVLDIRLEGEDSWPWLRELKAAAETCDIPVIVVSNAADPAMANAVGADACLAKPIDRGHLLSELDRLLGSRVLVIEDDEATRYTLRRLLDTARYRVLEAGDGRTGLHAARCGHPELILLDLGLPDVDGVDVLAQLEADEATRDIPVVIATARDLTVQEHSALRSRSRGVLTKRELEDNVVATVSAALAPATSPRLP
jgi:signal transduction histidine kinase/DNA-binding response OmpR family regulator